MGILDEKVVLVTGAGQGIGRGIAEAAAEAGATVVATDVDARAARDTAEYLEAEGHRSLGLELDVTREADFSAAVERSVDELGSLDALVNNAGVLTMGAAAEHSVDDWRRQLEVNVIGTAIGCTVVCQHFRRHGGGAIVNVASNAGKVGYPNMAAYNASKAAVINLTRSLAAEWATFGINVNAVCPGGVATPMLTNVADWLGPRLDLDPEELVKGMVPAQLGRHIQPLEVGHVVAFLLSPRATIIRGQAINVDGGDTPY